MANFFGWHASFIFSVPLTLVKHRPNERGHPILKFGTSVFKACSLYPVGCLVLWELSVLFKVALLFLVARRGQLGWEFLFGSVASTRGKAAAWLSSCVYLVSQVLGSHLPMELHALKRGAAFCTDTLQLVPDKINMHVGWSPGSNSLLRYRWGVIVKATDGKLFADVLHCT